MNDKQTLTDWIKANGPDENADPDNVTIPGLDYIGEVTVSLTKDGWQAQVMSQWDSSLRRIPLCSIGTTKRESIDYLVRRISTFRTQMAKVYDRLYTVQQELEEWMKLDSAQEETLAELAAEGQKLEM